MYNGLSAFYLNWFITNILPFLLQQVTREDDLLKSANDTLINTVSKALQGDFDVRKIIKAVSENINILKWLKDEFESKFSINHSY